MGEGFVKLRSAYKNYTHTIHIHNNYHCLRWRISEIRLEKMKKNQQQNNSTDAES